MGGEERIQKLKSAILEMKANEARVVIASAGNRLPLVKILKETGFVDKTRCSFVFSFFYTDLFFGPGSVYFWIFLLLCLTMFLIPGP